MDTLLVAIAQDKRNIETVIADLERIDTWLEDFKTENPETYEALNKRMADITPDLTLIEVGFALSHALSHLIVAKYHLLKQELG